MDIGYARVSTVEQNLQLQLDALDKAGCDPIYQEKASGKAGADRRVQEAVLRELKPGDTLTVWRLDRLGRYSFMDIYQTVKGLHERGITFRSLTESIDLSSPTGELILILMAWFAELERNIIIERTRAGKAARKANGLHAGGPRTFGFAKDRTTVIESEAKLLQDAAEHVLSNEPLARLVDYWNAEDVPAKNGGKWNETTLRRMLVSPTLVPAIIDERTHERLVQLFAPAKQRQQQGAPAKHLLSGILECTCGAKMYAQMVKTRGVSHEAYTCRRSYGGRWRGCGKVSIRSDTVEQWIAAAAADAVCSERFTATVNARRAALLEGEATSDELDDMQAEIGELDTILGTRYGSDEHRARRDDLQRRVRAATARLMARPELQELLDLPRTTEAFEAAWNGWDIAERRRKLRLLLHKVIVKPAGKGTRFNRSRLDPDWKV